MKEETMSKHAFALIDDINQVFFNLDKEADALKSAKIKELVEEGLNLLHKIEKILGMSFNKLK
jgi:hypothetical protein